ncbi:MAG: glycosyltransferase [Clostridia bacterium]|nr:glycosyltransferase [Clostridia bacterium]
MSSFSVGLFNDSFPPVIDGVAQTVKNYAENLSKTDCRVTVVTPKYRGVQDHYPFDVVRYPSLSIGARIGYRMGIPFDPDTIHHLRSRRFDLMHVHAPFASSVLVNTINHRPKVPVVLTYHTRFDLDLKKRIPNPAMRKVAMKFMLENVKSADEVWVVTKSCGRFLHDIGYYGPWRVMENGTDFARGKADAADITALREKYDLREDVPVFLFVGRMMWYKNIRLMLDTYALLKQNGMPFRAFFIGEGYDLPAMKQYVHELGLDEEVIFTGPIRDRDYLRVFYSTADLFFFPSTYDTCGIVVKEAAACDCPSLLVRDSCAAEGAIHKASGYLADETPAACADVIMDACADRAAMKLVGERASRDLYLTWEDAVARAHDRYREILKR